MVAPNFAKCPICGSYEFGVHTAERLYGSNQLSLTVEGGTLLAASFGLTEPDWNSSTTRYYVADCCGEELPEEHQAALDAILPNSRQLDE